MRNLMTSAYGIIIPTEKWKPGNHFSISGCKWDLFFAQVYEGSVTLSPLARHGPGGQNDGPPKTQQVDVWISGFPKIRVP